MKHRNFRRICIGLVLGSLIVLGSFSVASADGPIITGPTHFEGSAELWDCSSFKIIDYYVQDLTAIRFYDEAGQFERLVSQAQGTDTFTNSKTGRVYTGSYHTTLIINFGLPGPGVIEAAEIYRLPVRGAGVVVLDV